MAAAIQLKGTARNPQNSGYLTVKQAAVNLPGDTSIGNIEAAFHFAGNEIQVDRLIGGSSRSGGFMVTGRAVLGGAAPELDLQLQVNQFRFVEEHLERFNPSLRGLVVRGTFQSVDREQGTEPEPLRVTGAWNQPKISGALRLARATSGLPPDVPPRSAAKPAIDPELDVRLFVGNEVAIRNPLVEMRLDGSLAISNTLSTPVIAGRLAVSRGSLQLPMMRFRIEGSIRVAYDARQASSAAAPVSVDLTGVSHLSWRDTASQPAEDVQVVLTVRGSPGSGAASDAAGQRSPLSDQMFLGSTQGLSVEIHSDPPVPSEQLSSVLRQQLGMEGIASSDANVQSVLRQQVQLALANTVAPMFTSRLEDYLQQALKLDVLSIEVGGIEQPLQVRIGKRFIGGLYGSMLQQVGTAGESSQSWELYYRLTRGLRLGMRREEPSSRDLYFLSGSLRFR
jgi:autotransporter translocation and assembly factor TamB